ncbi:hypothetical protein BPOR_0450g00090 [Botrytis porri]|uniref:Uncharacterized protein n=1 Tax=Botrytis porri TaxID=87229 RepID=A0A4Z1KRU3_9HELO|nr:hypothetical protein BPOR_0450g00090 [Botrytis porri]
MPRSIIVPDEGIHTALLTYSDYSPPKEPKIQAKEIEMAYIIRGEKKQRTRMIYQVAALGN